jgi:hypothetical protein
MEANQAEVLDKLKKLTDDQRKWVFSEINKET